ncbi:hypothetical protein ACQP1G_23900 [Nocardia sp. CA-107356]|uniref:hypothetical protein n=1 Tax=Nocardia sp. CA-107356 TaxID=3239972 RepID=UPI003D8EF766
MLLMMERPTLYSSAKSAFLGQVREARVVVGVVVPAVDSFPCCETQFRCFAFESAFGHAFASAEVPEVGFEFGGHCRGL